MHLKGDLAGTYYPLSNLSEEEARKLRQDHILFEESDKFISSVGGNRDWPEGRGIYISNDKKFIVWVNEEDHLKIISMQSGANFAEIFKRLARGVEEIDKHLKFTFSETHGYFSSCPTNLGTGMKASVHVHLPVLGDHPEHMA